MANKFLDDVGVKHLWEKATSIFAKKSDIANVSNTLIVTCVVDFASSSLTNVSHTHTEIQSAYERNEHIILNADVSQMTPNGKACIPLVMIDDNGACFSTVVYMGDTVNFVLGINADGSTYMLTTSLVSQEQLDTRLGGLTLGLSDTAPTDGNPNIITFANEG